MDLYDWLPTTLFRSKRQEFTLKKDEMTITKSHFQTIEKQNSISNRYPTAVSCNKHVRTQHASINLEYKSAGNVCIYTQ